MKAIYKIIDIQGRVIIPKEMREAVDIYSGDIVELKITDRGILIEKTDIIKLGDDSVETMSNTVVSTAKKMDRKNLLKMARKLVELAEKREKKSD